MLIYRSLYDEIKHHLIQKEITLIIGPRQVGKTTLMMELYNELRSKGDKVLFLSLDFEPDSRFFETQELLLNKIRLEIGSSGYVFVDEIQRKENAGLFLKGIYDKNQSYKFVITGSGSLELKEKIHESLIGRKREFFLRPVSFEEFINYKTEYKYKEKLKDFFNLEREKVNLLLREYLSFGGYPRIVIEDNIIEKRKLIDEIYKSYVQRDIVSLLNIDRSEYFDLLIKILASQTGKMINYSHLAALLGISTITLKKYLYYAEKTFAIQTLTPFTRNYIKELTKSKTVYFYDLGLRNFANNSFSLDLNQNELGFLFQNFAKNLIEEKLNWKSWTLHFWRTTDKAEVDFVVDKGNEIIPIEVKYSDQKAVKRSFRSFIDKYNPRKGLVITRSHSDQIKIENTDVIFIPFYELITNETILN